MRLPWFLKIGAKIILTRIPIPHRLRTRLGMFRHGSMQQFEYACQVFQHHLEYAGLQGGPGNAHKVILELGPGESLFTALLSQAYGFERSLLVDVGNFALPSVEIYREFARWLGARGLKLAGLQECASQAEMLVRLQAEYHTGGLRSLQALPDASVDLVFSQAVLEHVRRNEFDQTLREIRRILKAGGVSTHVIDLRDHLDSSLNNLRFPERTWESDLFTGSGFYTNRLRVNELLEAFSSAGFEAEILSQSAWEVLPLARQALAAQFRPLPDDILRISGLTVRLRPRR